MDHIANWQRHIYNLSAPDNAEDVTWMQSVNLVNFSTQGRYSAATTLDV